jgi:hypothetical protein
VISAPPAGPRAAGIGPSFQPPACPCPRATEGRYRPALARTVVGLGAPWHISLGLTGRQETARNYSLLSVTMKILSIPLGGKICRPARVRSPGGRPKPCTRKDFRLRN